METQITDLTTDSLEQQLIELESYVAQARARQVSLLREADSRQIPLGDGCRSLQEWTAGRLDVAPETSKQLVAALRVLEIQPELEKELADGVCSFDRTLATARLAAVGAPVEQVEQSAGLDITGVRKLAALRRRMTSTAEQQTFRDRFVSMQPTLDRTSYRLWGQLPGVDGELVEQALLTRADQFPTLPDGSRGTIGQRQADSLVAISQDSLTGTSGGGDSSSGPVLSVFTTGELAAESEGQAGSVTATGLSVGRSTIEEVFCSGSVEHITFHNRQPIAAGRTTRVIPPKLRRAILYRDGGCGADGCTSRYRLQPHHKIPWSQGGKTDPNNLTTLCWFHHHVVIHQMGYTIKPNSPPGRLRFQKPPGNDPP
ncbi:MAG: DUF222 domain-containing protein [Acidimicrobiia bacterium]|nr:DUF222 domain-containing protein [Acidimicrobiia bacterium]